MPNDIFGKMLSTYELTSAEQRRNATTEIYQEIILTGLYHGGFFDKASFCGDACLRIIHGLPRFSDGLEFSLLKPEEGFSFFDYSRAIADAFLLFGQKVEIKKRKNMSREDSAFVIESATVYDVVLESEASSEITIEITTQPKLKTATEPKLLRALIPLYVRCFTLPCLFAQKMHALVYRAWEHRIKGRDWYDFEWYVRHGVALDFAHLHERILQFNGKDVSKEEFLEKLKERFALSDIDEVKADVIPFVRDTKELAIWSNDYFVQLAQMVRFA